MNNSQAVNRLVMVDALRGFALFGLFVVHMVEYFELYWYKPEPGWVHNSIFFLFGGKAHLIFALLFGLSFYLIMEGQRLKGKDYRWRFCWRLALLLIMGWLHSLLYAGDILQVLALSGFLLIAVYRAPAKLIYILITLFFLQIPSFAWLMYLASSAAMAEHQPYFYPLMGENFRHFAHASFSELLHYNMWSGQWGKWAFFLETGRLWSIVGMFLLGFLLGKAKVFENIQRYVRSYCLLFIVATAIYFLIIAVKDALLQGISRPSVSIIAGNIITDFENLALTFSLIALFLIAYYLLHFGKGLNTLAACGRMSLTLYILQSVIGVPLYYGFGLGWYDGMGQINSLWIGLLLFALQMVFANLWFKAFRYGPLEWVWRSLTLMRKDIPFRAESRAA